LEQKNPVGIDPAVLGSTTRRTLRCHKKIFKLVVNILLSGFGIIMDSDNGTQ
jgi:hypothetical protein